MLPRFKYERCLVIFQATGRIYECGSTTPDEKTDGFEAFSMALCELKIYVGIVDLSAIKSIMYGKLSIRMCCGR